jgi:hypothetical protein
MAMLMFACPRAHRPVPTGIEVEPTDVNFLFNVAHTTVCPHCGETHVWDLHEAWLADSPATPEMEPKSARRGESDISDRVHLVDAQSEK